MALVALTPSGDAPFVAATFLATVGTLATFVMILTESTATETAAVCAPVAIGMVAFLPGLSARFARLPIGYAAPRSAADDEFLGDSPQQNGDDDRAVDGERIALQARRGHEMLLGLVGGCAAVVVGSAAVLGFAGNLWGQLLALASGLAMLLRARLFRYTSQVACVLVAGIAAIALLVLGLSLNPPLDLVKDLLMYGDRGGLDIRTIWLTASVAMRRRADHRHRPDHPEEGPLAVLGPPPRPRRGLRPPLPRPPLPRRPRRLHVGPLPHQQVAPRAVGLRRTGTLCDGRLCTRFRKAPDLLGKPLEAAPIGPSPVESRKLPLRSRPGALAGARTLKRRSAWLSTPLSRSRS